jgi:hypothetical protein
MFGLVRSTDEQTTVDSPKDGTILITIVEVPPGETEGSAVMNTGKLGVTSAYMHAAPISKLPETPCGKVVLLHIDTATSDGVYVTNSAGDEVHGHLVLAGERRFLTDVGEQTTFTVRCLEVCDESRWFKISTGIHRKLHVGNEAGSSGFSKGSPIREVYV